MADVNFIPTPYIATTDIASAAISLPRVAETFAPTAYLHTVSQSQHDSIGGTNTTFISCGGLIQTNMVAYCTEIGSGFTPQEVVLRIIRTNTWPIPNINSQTTIHEAVQTINNSGNSVSFALAALNITAASTWAYQGAVSARWLAGSTGGSIGRITYVSFITNEMRR